MPDSEHPDPEDLSTTADERDDDLDEAEAEEPQKLGLEVKVDRRSTCERHITVTVPREDIERYFDKEFSELMPTAQVAGFRPGHAPRKLVEKQFRKGIADKVKSTLLMDSLAQVNEDEELSAISEPEIDLDAVDLPADGAMTFEFDLEVRPEFALPKWKGLTIEKPVREFTTEDVDRAMQSLLANRGRLVPFDGAAEPGDYITVNLTFKQGEQVLSSATEEVIRIRPVLSFRDGRIEGFDRIMAGVRAGETRQADAQLTQDAPNEALRGQSVTGTLEVLEVKKLEVPELTPDLLQELGGFELESDLRDAIKDTLQRRLEYQQRQRAREQITAALTEAADWDLPPALLQRQSRRELQRAVMELQRSGFGEDEIRAHENELRQNSAVSTARALKEHFILERIAEEEEIDVADQDYDAEIALIAYQTQESPRRVRARLEKAGSMDVLRNQIVERKVVEKIVEHASFREVPYETGETDAAAIELAAGGGEHAEIPDAKPGGEESPHMGKPEEHRPHV